MSQSFYIFLGFTSNPFENNTAEREPDIAAYAVRPPYLDRVLTTSRAKGIFVLSGSRGSGKSATRLTVAKALWAETNGPLVVPLINFNIFKAQAKSSISLDLFATQIIFLTVENLLTWLSNLPTIEAEKKLASLDKSALSLIRKIVGTFYLSRSDNARQTSANECFSTLDVSLPQKSLFWLEKRWDAVANTVATFATKLGEKYFDADFGDPTTYAALLKQQANEGFPDPQYVFSKAVEVARLFGFSGVAIQIDKVDETAWTATDVSAGAQLIYPLLANIQLHEIDGLTWSFFLWDKVKINFSTENDRAVRWDKIPNGVISWSTDYLTELIQRRIVHFSNGKLGGLADISVTGLDISKTTAILIDLSEDSPRNLISLLDVILSEHIQNNQHVPRLLDVDAFNNGMDSYARRSLGDSGHTSVAEQIAKVQLTRFSTRDVAARFGKGQQAARSRIDSWVQTGLVAYDGSDVGPLGGRPVDFFAVGDPRVRRVIERKL